MAELYQAIDTSHVVGLRDRALISLMLFTFSRVGAGIEMDVLDFFSSKKRWWVRLHEKNGKEHEMPAHSKLEEHMDAYLDAVGIREEKNLPLFRTARGRTRELTENRMTQPDVFRVVRRRTAAAGIARVAPSGASRPTFVKLSTSQLTQSSARESNRCGRCRLYPVDGRCVHRSNRVGLAAGWPEDDRGDSRRNSLRRR